MKRRLFHSLLAVSVLAGLVLAGAAGAVDHASVGVGHVVVVPDPDRTNPCPGSELVYNHDSSFENGYMWRYGGIVPPYYGAFAEGLNGYGPVCGAAFWFTTLSGLFLDQSMDCYVWDSDGTNPGNVITVTTDVHITAPALWPSISQHDVDLVDADVDEDFFVGYWGNWPGLPGGWFVAADLDGFGGIPRTDLAPGSGYGTGWADPSLIWGPTQSLGIGGYLGGIGPPPPPSPAQVTTWGRIKELF